MYLSVLAHYRLTNKGLEWHTGPAYFIEQTDSIVDVTLQRELAKRLVIQNLRQSTHDRVLKCRIVAHETNSLVIKYSTKQDVC